MANTDSSRTKRRDTDDKRPDIWVGYGKLVKLFRERAGLTQQALGEALGYSCELVASVEQGRRPAKSTFEESTRFLERLAGEA
ncbi:helix-turn-helix domain-containing protein [Streptomyces sp. TP-A0874]|uniref:helix-turn-helix domain-containing protein n=1 Tax=Streptomyces sp. TP-A0874 TaxID=549819 RepID=UPI000853B27C|nr:helix-turn-helix transcriptional regulator [Streptomyces sp. TP-A0874]